MDSLLGTNMDPSTLISSLILCVIQKLLEGPDSLASYNTMVEVMKTIDFSQKGIKLTYQYNPLTWHFYAYKIHQGNKFFIQHSSLSSKMQDHFKLKSLFPIYLPIKMILQRRPGLIKLLVNF